MAATIPSLSLAIPNDDFLAAERGIYANANQRGVEWERAVSVELIDPSDADSTFQVGGGIRAPGGVGRGTGTARHSRRLLFKENYGPTKLNYPLFADTDAEPFNGICLRGGWNDTQTGGRGGRPAIVVSAEANGGREASLLYSTRIDFRRACPGGITTGWLPLALS